MIKGQEAELAILNWLRINKSKVPFIAATDSRSEAIELYNNGACYVIETKELAANHFRLLLEEHGTSIDNLSAKGKIHHMDISENS